MANYKQKRKDENMEAMKINRLEIENTKRIKAVKIEPTASGLTIVGGNNNQGKTSVLDSIAWALGGDKFKPTAPQHDGSVIPPNLHIVMSNGLVVERKGKNSSLKVTDPDGNKGGQQLLNEFVEQLAIDLPRFMESSGKEKAHTLLQIIGVGGQLNELEEKEQDVYNRRTAIGQIADQKKKFADEQTYFPDAPKDLISPSDLIKQQQEILARNGENQKKRENVEHWRQAVDYVSQAVEQVNLKIASLKDELAIKESELVDAQKTLETAMMSTKDLQDQSTAELEQSISNIEEINHKVRTNLDKHKAEEDANDYSNQYSELTAEITSIRKEKIELLQSAELPLPELSVNEGELIYKGKKWDSMSGSDRLKVSTAIVRKLNPRCGFVLLDKLEQMDLSTLQEFGAWLEAEGLQAIATRVSTGDECSIIIEDGYVAESKADAKEPQEKKWEAGNF